MAFMMYGYDAGVLGGVQGTKPFLDSIGNPTGTFVIPMIASSYTLAAAVCSLAVMIIGMPLGRRNCILLGDAFVIVGAALQASSFSVAQMIVSRILCGIGIGFISCSVPTYMAEMSIESKERGPEVSIQCIYLISGVALAYWVGFGVSKSEMQLWRLPIAFQAAFAIVSGACMLALPDTPRWYYAKGRDGEGDEVLCRLWDRELADERVQGMRMEIMASIKLEAEEENRFVWTDLVWDRSDLRGGRRIRISFLILSIQQMMGESVLSHTKRASVADGTKQASTSQSTTAHRSSYRSAYPNPSPSCWQRLWRQALQPARTLFHGRSSGSAVVRSCSGLPQR